MQDLRVLTSSLGERKAKKGLYMDKKDLSGNGR